MSDPLVSVVMGVYNAERSLLASLQSVLSQKEVSCEFILVDDGSTDGSGVILEDAASRDARVRLLRQSNCGLTMSLIRGCEAARGEFIARHDADDLSYPGRFARQVRMLQTEPRMAFASCWTRTIGPEDELLLETCRPADPTLATRRLLEHQEGPCHGSVMFHKAAYQRAGGYRTAFRYSQDWDLWLRLADQGLLGYVPEFLFAFRVSGAAISTRRRHQQTRLLQTSLHCRAARLRGEDEQPWLDEAARICAEPPPPGRRSTVENDYFIGKCLFDRRDRRALRYLRRCVRQEPWSWRHWLALSAGTLLCRRTAS